jgi:hypothetical protein
VLLGLLEAACRRAEELDLAGRLPMAEALRLRRGRDGLEVIEIDEIDWRALMVGLTRVEGFWPDLVGRIDGLRSDQDIELTIGWDSDEAVRAQTLWRDVLAPILQRYRDLSCDWIWDGDLAAEVLRSWRIGHRKIERARRCLAPLENCRSMVEEVVIEPGLSIRRLTDADRDEIWRRYGAEHFPGAINPTIAELENWECAIDYRWQMEPPRPLNDSPALKVVRDVLRALRLHHPGVAAMTVLWHGTDPSDPWSPNRGDGLMAPDGPGPRPAGDLLASQLGPNCGPQLRRLLTSLRAVEGDRSLQLALDRFDSAYGRQSPEDRLIDLWIAFEALLIPDGSAELSYRASLRLAQLVGADGEARETAFKLARESYGYRSKVVHGEPKVKNLGRVVEQTRLLAREALRAWILEPPADGVADLDRANFQ